MRLTLAGLATAVLSHAAPSATTPVEDGPYYTVPCREVRWSELCAVFDPAWILPGPGAHREADSTRERDAELGDRDLAERLEALATDRWGDAGSLRCLGDLVAASDGSGRRERDALLDRFRREQPDAWSAWGDLVEQLLVDDGLTIADWDPDDDEDDDGIYLGRPWSLQGAVSPPWCDIEGNRDVHQGAVLIRADLEAIKDAENDYATYPGYAGAEYEAIYPVPDRHVRAAPPEDSDARSAMQLFFRVDLPFPFGDYSCLLRILNRVDGDGHLVTDIYSTSDDFYWLAGRDVFVPVTTSSGEFAGMLVARWFGFDIEGVPDGTSARQAGLRAGLGRLKLRAERAYMRVSDGPRTVSGRVPPFVVRGDRRWRR